MREPEEEPFDSTRPDAVDESDPDYKAGWRSVDDAPDVVEVDFTKKPRLPK